MEQVQSATLKQTEAKLKADMDTVQEYLQEKQNNANRQALTSIVNFVDLANS